MRIHRVGDAVVVLAPAKLNLFLEVLSRRPDGFHELETLMVAITIHDTLALTSHAGGEVSLIGGWLPGLQAQRIAGAGDEGTPWQALPIGRDNLVVRAIERLRQRAGVEKGAQIALWKRIPAAAGLGGASTDAAAALAAANQAWGLGWTSAQLALVGAEVGSDVPFFFSSGAAVCRGRGERVEALTPRGDLHFVVVRPPAGLATADVYRVCRPADPALHCRAIVNAWQAGDAIRLGRALHNRLQPAAESLSPWIDQLRRQFSRMDVLGHQMSGSGTSYFAVCRHQRQARRIAGYLRTLGLTAVYCASSDGSQLVRP